MEVTLCGFFPLIDSELLSGHFQFYITFNDALEISREEREYIRTNAPTEYIRVADQPRNQRREASLIDKF